MDCVLLWYVSNNYFTTFVILHFWNLLQNINALINGNEEIRYRTVCIKIICSSISNTLSALQYDGYYLLLLQDQMRKLILNLAHYLLQHSHRFIYNCALHFIQCSNLSSQYIHLSDLAFCNLPITFKKEFIPLIGNPCNSRYFNMETQAGNTKVLPRRSLSLQKNRVTIKKIISQLHITTIPLYLTDSTRSSAST